MRSEGSYVLIDLDGSAHIGVGYSGIKISSAYSSPELVYKKRNNEEYGMKQYYDISKDNNNNNNNNYNNNNNNNNNNKRDYKLLSAHPSIDAWALGIIIYFLITSSNLFACDFVSENICDSKDLENLFKFQDSFKQNMLSKISDLQVLLLLLLLLLLLFIDSVIKKLLF